MDQVDREEEASQASQDWAFQGVASLGMVLLEVEEAHQAVGVQQAEEVEGTPNLEATPCQSSMVIALMQITL